MCAPYFLLPPKNLKKEKKILVRCKFSLRSGVRCQTSLGREVKYEFELVSRWMSSRVVYRLLLWHGSGKQQNTKDWLLRALGSFKMTDKELGCVEICLAKEYWRVRLTYYVWKTLVTLVCVFLVLPSWAARKNYFSDSLFWLAAVICLFL